MFVEISDKRKGKIVDGAGVAIVNPPQGFYNHIHDDILPAIQKNLRKNSHIGWITPDIEYDDPKKFSWFRENRDTKIDNPEILKQINPDTHKTTEWKKNHYDKWWNSYDFEARENEMSESTSYSWLLKFQEEMAEGAVAAAKGRKKIAKKAPKYPPKPKRVFKKHDWYAWKDTRPDPNEPDDTVRYKRV